MRPQLSPLPGTSSKSKTAGRPPPPPPPHPANPVPQICTCICNHRILPTTTSANPDPLVKFVCVCFGGAIQISKFSPNPMTLRKKFSKMISWLGGCLPCSNCATHVSCFSSTNHDNNHSVVTINDYYGNTQGKEKLVVTVASWKEEAKVTVASKMLCQILYRCNCWKGLMRWLSVA